MKIAFWLDVMLLATACALQTVPFTGLVLHEWLGLAMAGMVFAHLLLSWSWIASHSRRLFAVQSARARINYLLNLSLFGGVTAVIFSGVLISNKAIPMLIGTKAAPDMDWRWDSFTTSSRLPWSFWRGFIWRSIGTGRSRPDRRFSAGRGGL